MAERTNPPPGERRQAIAGSIPASAAPTDAAPADPIEQEWDRLERERVAGEIAEAHEDVVEAIAHPVRGRGGNWVWWAFLAALLAGVVFAGAVNLFYVPARQAPAGNDIPTGPRSPSAREAGPGVDGTDAETSSDDDPEATPPATGV